MQFTAAGQVVPFKQTTTYMTADGVAKASSFGGFEHLNEHLVAARRQTHSAVCEGMSDNQVLGGGIDKDIHACRTLLYSYRYIHGRWELLPLQSTFPLMVNLHLSAESCGAIVHDVQAWYNDPERSSSTLSSRAHATTRRLRR